MKLNIHLKPSKESLDYVDSVFKLIDSMDFIPEFTVTLIIHEPKPLVRIKYGVFETSAYQGTPLKSIFKNLRKVKSIGKPRC